MIAGLLGLTLGLAVVVAFIYMLCQAFGDVRASTAGQRAQLRQQARDARRAAQTPNRPEWARTRQPAPPWKGASS